MLLGIGKERIDRMSPANNFAGNFCIPMKSQNILLGATFSTDAQCHVVFDYRNQVWERLASGPELQGHGLDLGMGSFSLLGPLPYWLGRRHGSKVGSGLGTDNLVQRAFPSEVREKTWDWGGPGPSDSVVVLPYIDIRVCQLQSMTGFFFRCFLNRL